MGVEKHSCATVGTKIDLQYLNWLFSKPRGPDDLDSSRPIMIPNPSNGFRFPSLNSQSIAKPPEERVYVFGGKITDGGCTNQLYMLTFNESGCGLKLIFAKGKPPCPRYGSGMTSVESVSSLAIYGGTGKNLKTGVKMVQNDLFLFSWICNSWSQVTFDDPMPPRIHSTLVELPNGDLCLFGGRKTKGIATDNLIRLKNAAGIPLRPSDFRPSISTKKRSQIAL